MSYICKFRTNVQFLEYSYLYFVITCKHLSQEQFILYLSRYSGILNALLGMNVSEIWNAYLNNCEECCVIECNFM
jgi:hypothetical protein